MFSLRILIGLCDLNIATGIQVRDPHRLGAIEGAIWMGVIFAEFNLELWNSDSAANWRMRSCHVGLSNVRSGILSFYPGFEKMGFESRSFSYFGHVGA